MSKPDTINNPGFYCRDYIETNSNMPCLQKACTQQCDECVNAIIEHHERKQAEAILKEAFESAKRKYPNENWKAWKEIKIEREFVVNAMVAFKNTKTLNRQLLDFHNWMLANHWELHSSGEYYYRSDNRHHWPPEETCSESELIEKFHCRHD